MNALKNNAAVSQDISLSNATLATEASPTPASSSLPRSTFDKNLMGIGGALALGAAAFSPEAKSQYMPDGANLANHQAVAVPYADNIGYLRMKDNVGEFGASFVAYDGVTIGLSGYTLAFTAGHLFTEFSAGQPFVKYAVQGLSRSGTQVQPIASWVYPGYDGTLNTPDIAILLFQDLGAPSLTLAQAGANTTVTTAGFGRYKTPSTSAQLTPDAASGWQAKIDSLGFGYANSAIYQFTDFGFNLDGVANNGRSITGFSGAGAFLDSTTLLGVNVGHGGSDNSTSGSSAFVKFTPEILAWENEVRNIYAPAMVPEPNALGLVGVGMAVALVARRNKT